MTCLGVTKQGGNFLLTQPIFVTPATCCHCCSSRSQGAMGESGMLSVPRRPQIYAELPRKLLYKLVSKKAL